MLVVRVELHSAVTGKVTELGRMLIANDGTRGNGDVGDYHVRLGRRGVTDNKQIFLKPQRKSRVFDHKRKSLSVWSLVFKALSSVGVHPGRRVVVSEDGEEPLDL